MLLEDVLTPEYLEKFRSEDTTPDVRRTREITREIVELLMENEDPETSASRASSSDTEGAPETVVVTHEDAAPTESAAPAVTPETDKAPETVEVAASNDDNAAPPADAPTETATATDSTETPTGNASAPTQSVVAGTVPDTSSTPSAEGDVKPMEIDAPAPETPASDTAPVSATEVARDEAVPMDATIPVPEVETIPETPTIPAAATAPEPATNPAVPATEVPSAGTNLFQEMAERFREQALGALPPTDAAQPTSDGVVPAATGAPEAIPVLEKTAPGAATIPVPEAIPAATATPSTDASAAKGPDALPAETRAEREAVRTKKIAAALSTLGELLVEEGASGGGGGLDFEDVMDEENLNRVLSKNPETKEKVRKLLTYASAAAEKTAAAASTEMAERLRSLEQKNAALVSQFGVAASKIEQLQKASAEREEALRKEKEAAEERLRQRELRAAETARSAASVKDAVDEVKRRASGPLAVDGGKRAPRSAADPDAAGAEKTAGDDEKKDKDKDASSDEGRKKESKTSGTGHRRDAGAGEKRAGGNPLESRIHDTDKPSHQPRSHTSMASIQEGDRFPAKRRAEDDAEGDETSPSLSKRPKSELSSPETSNSAAAAGERNGRPDDFMGALNNVYRSGLLGIKSMPGMETKCITAGMVTQVLLNVNEAASRVVTSRSAASGDDVQKVVAELPLIQQDAFRLTHPPIAQGYHQGEPRFYINAKHVAPDLFAQMCSLVG